MLRKNVEAYGKIARQASRVSRQHRTKPEETVVFAWITYKSRAHRDRVTARVMKDPGLLAIVKNVKMPFDVKRMVYGGFKTIVKA